MIFGSTGACVELVLRISYQNVLDCQPWSRTDVGSCRFIGKLIRKHTS